MGAFSEYLIIPDVHGRTFWRDAVEKFSDMPVVFLGDYLDPYPYDGISPRDAIENFQAIVDWKRSHMDNAVLLLGNHDFSYIAPGVCSSRRDRDNYEEICAMFEDGLNEKLFQMCLCIPEEGVLFSHAGVSLDWVNESLHHGILPQAGDGEVQPDFTEVDARLADELNAMLIERSKKFFNALSYVSGYRGGIDLYGSMVWADVCEMFNYDGKMMQIFGHTQLKSSPIVTEHWADLDCRQAFILNGERKVCFLDKTEVPLATIKDWTEE